MNRVATGAALVLFAWGMACTLSQTANAGPVDPAADAPAGKMDTFAQDTWLRRNKYPLSIKVIETAGKGGQNVPVTLSVACGEGDYPAGKLCPMLAGQPVPVQVDVLATWPSDKSIKHALVSLVLPKIGPKEAAEAAFVQAVPPVAGRFASAVDLKSLIAGTEFANKDGTKTVTAIDTGTLTRLADALEGKLGGDELKKLAPRMAGPICYEFEVKAPARTGDAPDKDIDVYYGVRIYSGIKAARVEYIVENTRLPAKPYPNPFTVTDREFEKVAFRLGSAGRAETVYEQGATTHWFATRYRVCRWWGEYPAQVYAKESVPYLVHAQFIPKLDLEHPLSEAELAIESKRIAKTAWYREPAEFPDGLPLSNGPVHAFMGDYGGRPEIGFYPLWACLAWASDSPAMAHHARLWEGNALGAFPVHARPAENGQAGASGNDMMRQMLYTMHHHPENAPKIRHVTVGPGITTHGGSSKGCSNSADTGHVPSAAYCTYLATGERFYEDELCFWAAAMLLGDKLQIRGHSRYEAWPLRNATDAAFILPDCHPMKKYFAEVVQNSVDWQAEQAKDLEKYWGIGGRTGAARSSWACSGYTSMWQECFNIWVLDNAARKGFSSAAAVREAEADMLYRLYEGKEEYKASNGKVYRWSNPKYMIPYSIAIDIRTMDFSDPKNVKQLDIKSILDNTGAMYYYTMLNEQLQYKEANAAEFAAKLPRKVMAPEDWALDPEFEKKFAEKASGYVTTVNGLPPTAAALARYDNLRAKKMYQFVRDLLDKDSPKRIRGIELMN